MAAAEPPLGRRSIAALENGRPNARSTAANPTPCKIENWWWRLRLGADRSHTWLEIVRRVARMGNEAAVAMRCSDLLRRLVEVSDGRSEQGRVHPLAVVLALGAAAVVAGICARSPR
jgi:hypothetical protein